VVGELKDGREVRKSPLDSRPRTGSTHAQIDHPPSGMHEPRGLKFRKYTVRQLLSPLLLVSAQKAEEANVAATSLSRGRAAAMILIILDSTWADNIAAIGGPSSLFAKSPERLRRVRDDK